MLDAEHADEPYFLAMNTRLQVEHPVTEMITGIDLIECQINSALGQPLAFAQSDIRRQGWAIEARINAEVPEHDYRASCGPIVGYAEPCARGLRVDSGIDQHSEVTPHYDSLLAKVIASGAQREVALARLLAGVRALRIDGVQTNQAFVAELLAHAAFNDVLSTRFLTEVFAGGWQPAAALAAERVGAAAAAWFLQAVPKPASDRPLDSLIGFRLTTAAGRPAAYPVQVDAGTEQRDVSVTWRAPDRIECLIDEVVCEFVADPARRWLHRGARRYHVSADAERVALWCDGDWRQWRVQPMVAARAAVDGARGTEADAVHAQLPGVVTQLLVQVGQTVTAGMPLLVLEAMKLVHTLTAPRDGVVARINVAAGDTVSGGAQLVSLEARPG